VAEKDSELDRLLARGRMGGPGHERVFAHVSKTIARREALHRPRVWAVTSVLAAAACVVLFVSRRPAVDERNAARGTPVHAFVEARCLGSETGRCRIGQRLVFRINGPKAGFVAAYAKPVGHAGERIWYFPNAGHRLPSLDSASEGSGPRFLSDVVIIGPEHSPGHYVISVYVLPVSALPDGFPARLPLGTERQTLELEVVP
jgi:hypothetical protein